MLKRLLPVFTLVLFTLSGRSQQLTYADLATFIQTLNTTFDLNSTPFTNLISTLLPRGYVLLSQKQIVNTSRAGNVQSICVFNFSSPNETASPAITLTSTHTGPQNAAPAGLNNEIYFYTNNLTEYAAWVTALKADPLCTFLAVTPFGGQYIYKEGGVRKSNNVGYGMAAKYQAINTVSTSASGDTKEVTGTTKGFESDAVQPYLYYIKISFDL